MNWSEVSEWLLNHGYMNSSWERVDITEDGFYAEDSFENIFISMIIGGGNELIIFVGCLHPNIFVGGVTDICVESYFDVVDYLNDNFEIYYEELCEKFQ